MSFLVFLGILGNAAVSNTPASLWKARKFLVIPGFLGFSCSSYCGQIPGFPWKPRVTSWLCRLFLEYHSRLSKKAKNFLAFPSFSRFFRGKKARKSRESQELLAFLCSPGFFFAGGCLFFEKMGLGALTQRKVLKFNRCLCSGSNFTCFSLVRCFLN